MMRHVYDKPSCIISEAESDKFSKSGNVLYKDVDNQYTIQLWPVEYVNIQNCQHKRYCMEGGAQSKIAFKG